MIRALVDRFRSPSLAFRIVVFFVSLLAGVLVLTFALVSAANLQISQNTSAAELKTGERVFHRLLETRGEQLRQAASVLALDFGFKQTIALNDRDTLRSALQNQGNRIHAQLLMVSGLDNRIQADTQHPEREGRTYPFASLLNKASEMGGASAIQWVDGQLYQLVVVPVKAPVVIAWVTIGFVIDDRSAKELRELSGLQVSLLGWRQGSWAMFASTLRPLQRSLLPAQLQPGADKPGRIVLGDEAFATLLTPLGGTASEPVYALLAQSIDQSLAPFYKLQGTLIALAGVALTICLLAGMRIARRITGPLRALARVAGHIEQGDYRQSIDIRDSSEIGRLAGSLSHMQNAIAEREAEITKLAYQDVLTGLPNRVRFNQLLARAIEETGQSGALTVLLIDLDRFQQINDTLGHPTGDRVLVEVAARLAEAVRDHDVVARLSGDEYALLLPGIPSTEALHTISRIHTVFDRRFELDGRPLDLRASIGAASYPEHGSDAIDLLRCADLAMYRAKRGGERQAIYDPSYRTFRQEHLSLLGDLQLAVERNELTVYYQPKVSLHTGEANEAEALVRWIHPERGFVPPGDFIPFAEQTGYISEVTRWVLRHVMDEAGRWAKAGAPVKVSVNLSTRDLLDPSLVAFVADGLARAGLPPALLCLEITESGFMEDPSHALGILKQLRGLGVGLAIDDYGTGFSSLAYLRQLPITELKIDRAFVLELDHNQSDAMIVRSTIELGHRLGLKVVAEGVETQAIVDVLRSMDCDLIQGYFYSKPLPVQAFIDWRQQRAAAGQAAIRGA
ncbi:EAL domain-containing protein [Chitinimonas sp.]|uniref:bifunctional diguanylate cyclase/phosphodiesterase n=1 Tax=Chitinimonas sp. TaxID=1934313 RepID=UPI0035AF9723